MQLCFLFLKPDINLASNPPSSLNRTAYRRLSCANLVVLQGCIAIHPYGMADFKEMMVMCENEAIFPARANDDIQMK